MAIDYTMPKLAMAMNEGTIAEWLVSHGDYVKKGQTLASIETEKVAYDVESPEEGYFHIVVEAGETVPCEALIAHFLETPEEAVTAAEPATAAEASAAPAKDTPPATIESPPAVSPQRGGQRIKASPLAKKIAANAGLDIASITGTGPGGRIVKRDVLGAQTAQASTPRASGGNLVLAELPLKGMRGTIASRMQESLQSTAQLTSNWESDVTALLAMRKSFVARDETLGTRVSFNAFLIKAMVYAIRQVPMANACVEDDLISIYENINMGVAISVPGASEFDTGLMVGVLKDVDRMGVVEIDKQMRSLIGRVRNGEATADDLSGSTITLSSTAGIGPPGLMSTPLLNLPNVALLGPSTPVERIVAVKGKKKVRTMLPLSFTFDHRALDGEPAARYMRALHDALENPELLLA
ncbi:dihydrolipoamide acetyltransferase family protein [Congregibacter brevis]|uniref:Dihydrolipoamide acetyltransferase component of pyruvate dehydrogenase complex n=1 Tax=Congregibacter brevis TaxID=3081201 RepID=A0ABZ0IFX6_9GAMM|nr:dihydrolipoamide acetyltransferase family protein [Congregibacter sp. IMCC45268]